MKPLTKEQAIWLGKQGWWKTKTPKEIALFQLEAQTCCMPFGEFMKALTAALGRPVFEIEMMNPGHLLAELNGQPGPQSINDILDTLPEEIRRKVIAVELEKD